MSFQAGGKLIFCVVESERLPNSSFWAFSPIYASSQGVLSSSHCLHWSESCDSKHILVIHHNHSVMRRIVVLVGDVSHVTSHVKCSGTTLHPLIAAEKQISGVKHIPLQPDTSTYHLLQFGYKPCRRYQHEKSPQVNENAVLRTIQQWLENTVTGKEKSVQEPDIHRHTAKEDECPLYTDTVTCKFNGNINEQRHNNEFCPPPSAHQVPG